MASRSSRSRGARPRHHAAAGAAAVAGRKRLACRPSVEVRAPHHRPDADRSAAPRRRRPAQTIDDPTGQTGPRHAQQLRDGLHALGHVSHVRRELQRLLLPNDRLRMSEARSRSATASPVGLRLPLAHDPRPVQRRHVPERSQPVRLGRGDRSVQSAIDAGQAHRARTPQTRRRVGAGDASDGKIVVYMGDDERNEYIYRYVSNLPWREARRRGSIRSTTASSTSPSSTPTARATGCRSPPTTRCWPAGRSTTSSSTPAPPPTRPARR